MPNTYIRHTHVLKALSDETRLKIVHMLTNREMCANDLLEYFHMTQPSLSYHMKVLSDARVVKCERRATFSIYSVDPHVIEHIQDILSMLSVCESYTAPKQEVGR